jgi:hypothetical protein
MAKPSVVRAPSFAVLWIVVTGGSIASDYAAQMSVPTRSSAAPKRRSPGHLQIRLTVDHHPKAQPHELLIVDDDDLGRHDSDLRPEL